MASGHGVQACLSCRPHAPFDLSTPYELDRAATGDFAKRSWATRWLRGFGTHATWLNGELSQYLAPAVVETFKQHGNWVDLLGNATKIETKDATQKWLEKKLSSVLASASDYERMAKAWHERREKDLDQRMDQVLGAEIWERLKGASASDFEDFESFLSTMIEASDDD
jgi:hypothetical protein